MRGKRLRRPGRLYRVFRKNEITEGGREDRILYLAQKKLLTWAQKVHAGEKCKVSKYGGGEKNQFWCKYNGGALDGCRRKV